MTAISNNQIACACCLVLKDKTPAEQFVVFKKIVQFLARKHLLSKTSDILLQLEKIINSNEQKIIAKILSAKKLSKETKKDIANSLEKRYSAKEVVLEEKIDEKLLGGFRVEANDEVIDFSMKNKIVKLKSYLTKPT